jgi:hypothetical protein
MCRFVDGVFLVGVSSASSRMEFVDFARCLVNILGDSIGYKNSLGDYRIKERMVKILSFFGGIALTFTALWVYNIFKNNVYKEG